MSTAEEVKAYCKAEHAKAHAEIMTAYEAAFHQANAGGFTHGQIAWQATYAAALLSAAAVIAVDAGMPADRFVGIALESHQKADEGAPRFG